jgi:hypothetical protein
MRLPDRNRRRPQIAPDTPFSGSSDEPSPFVNIEFHQTFVSHFQKEGLAGFLIHDIGAFHDLVDFERLFAERAEDIFAIIQLQRPCFVNWSFKMSSRLQRRTAISDLRL